MPVGQKHIFQRARRIAVGDVNHFAAERIKRVQASRRWYGNSCIAQKNDLPAARRRKAIVLF